MKKQLMAGVAVLAVGAFAAGGAMAQGKMMKPSISVNGYYQTVVGGILDDSQETKYTYTAVDADGNGTPSVTAFDGTDDPMMKRNDKKDTSALDTRTDAEIHFNGRASTDDGIKYHMRVELEGQNDTSPTDPIDEYFLSIAGSFGQIILGGTGGAPVKMLTGMSGSWATQVGRNLNFYSHEWTPSAGGSFYTLQHIRLDTGDAEKVTYISPKLGGFQIGLTYSPGARNGDGDDNKRIDAEANRHDGYEAAVSYSGKFGDVGFGVGAGMTAYNGCNSCMADSKQYKDQSDWLIAGRIDFGGGFRVAAAHKQVTDDVKANQGSLTDIGVRFVQGANSFSLVGSHGEMKNSDASHTGMVASYARALGPGVKLFLSGLWNDSQSAVKQGDAFGADGAELEADDVANTDHLRQSSQSENSGMAVLTGITVSF